MTKAKTKATVLDKAVAAPPKVPTGVKGPTKAQRDFIAMERVMRDASKGLSKTATNATGQGQNAAIQGTGIDLEQLADLLAQRMSGSKALADAITPVGSACQGEKSLAARALTSDYNTASVGGSLRPANPIDQEFTIMDSSIDELNNVIDDLNGMLEPVLAYDEPSDSSEADSTLSKNSESPNHRRLITLNERMLNVIVRLRHMRSRVRN